MKMGERVRSISPSNFFKPVEADGGRLWSKVVCLAARSDRAGGSTLPHHWTLKQHSRQQDIKFSPNLDAKSKKEHLCSTWIFKNHFFPKCQNANKLQFLDEKCLAAKEFDKIGRCDPL